MSGIWDTIWIPNYHLNTGYLNTGLVKVCYSDVIVIKMFVIQIPTVPFLGFSQHFKLCLNSATPFFWKLFPNKFKTFIVRANIHIKKTCCNITFGLLFEKTRICSTGLETGCKPVLLLLNSLYQLNFFKQPNPTCIQLDLLNDPSYFQLDLLK